MTTTNKLLMTNARQSLSGKWKLAVGTNLLFNVINSLANEAVLIIGGPLQLGISIFSLKLARNKKADLEQLFDGFKDFVNSLLAYLLVIAFVLLWSLLLLIPGLIAALAYSQTFFILADNKGMTGGDAIRKSKALMNGHKWRLFCLHFRFIGWFLLSLLTLGIGFLWLAPYYNVTLAHFYDDLVKQSRG